MSKNLHGADKIRTYFRDVAGSGNIPRVALGGKQIVFRDACYPEGGAKRIRPPKTA